MKLPIYFVNAFADALGAGNPAAVVIEEGFQPALSDEERQLIAYEMNKSETAKSGLKVGRRSFLKELLRFRNLGLKDRSKCNS
jgi:hypothetical protein